MFYDTPSRDYFCVKSARNILSVNKLYHGGPEYVPYPKAIINEYTKDFGWGFYCTNLKEQAEKWAVKKGKKEGFIGKVSVYDWNPGVLNTLNVRDFAKVETEDEVREWLDFVILCRNGIHHDYDLVAGPLADDQIWKPIREYLINPTRINYAKLLRAAPFKYHTQQIVFCTKTALNCLTLLEDECYEV